MNLKAPLQLKRNLLGLLQYINIFGLPGICHALYCLFSSDAKPAQVSPRWSTTPIFIRLNTSDVNVFKQVFIEQEYGITKHMPSQPRTILDAGANIGLTSAYLAHRFPSATIYALEPEQNNVELLKLNTRHYQNVHVVQGALWNRDEPLEFESLEAESWAFRVRSSNNPATPAKVQGFRLGSLLRELGVERLGLLKLDIEGAEFELLEDHADWIDRVDNIVAEIHEGIRPGCNERFLDATRQFPYSAFKGELVLVSRNPLVPHESP